MSTFVIISFPIIFYDCKIFHVSFWPLTLIKRIINPSNLPLKLFPIHGISIQLTIADQELKVQSFSSFSKYGKINLKLFIFEKKSFSLHHRSFVNKSKIHQTWSESHLWDGEKFFMCRTRCTMAKLIYWLLNCVTYQNFKTEKLMNKKKNKHKLFCSLIRIEFLT